MDKKIEQFSNGEMIIFRFYYNYKNGVYVWRDKNIRLANIGTPSGVIPNVPEKMGEWGYRHGGDYDFYSTCKFKPLFEEDIIYVVKPKENGYTFR